jgi:TolB-like protein
MTPIAKPSRTSSSAPAVLVRTLGRFHVEVDGRALPVEGRAHRRPLQLLALLIALGGHEVPSVRLQEALWPEADGDRAQRSFATTLHRLRKLLGHDALRLQDGRLSLSPQRCRVDALEFATLPAPPAAGMDAAACSALATDLESYRGPFLEHAWDDPSVLAARERLHALFLSRSEAVARALEQDGRLEPAGAACTRALAIDPACEALARQLMICLRKAGRLEEAIEAFRRCRRALAARGALPSAETQALLQELLAEREAQVVPPEQPSLAVCPFASLGSDAALRWVAAGFTENLTAGLARLPRLTLIGWPAVGPGAAAPPPVRELGRELGVRFVLAGTVQADGRRLRVTAQLVEAASGQHLWAGRYDRALSDAFAVQDDIVECILVALQVQLTEGEQARTLWRGTTSNLRAWELAMRGLERFRLFTREGNEDARRLWTQALELDPTYVMALVPLGWTYHADARFGRAPDPRAARDRARSFAERALREDPGSGPAHVLLGHLRMMEGLHDEAEALLRRAAELNPGGADTAALVSAGLAFCGHAEEALGWARRAMRQVVLAALRAGAPPAPQAKRRGEKGARNSGSAPPRIASVT